MCGICGIVDFEQPPSRRRVSAMATAIVHRGPDEEGIEELGECVLGHRRLSIIDVESSRQPMPNEDETVWLAFNGEIYNFVALRTSLQSKGHTFATNGDGETIVHLYEEYGLDFVDHLNGMFAVALWDRTRKRLVLARDRLGIKPLYYAQSGSKVLFGSEAKAILAAGGVPLDIDYQAIAGFMNYQTVPGERTVFSAIRRLLPGHIATFDADGWKTQRYWDVDFRHKESWSTDTVVGQVEAVLSDCVQTRLVSDVPIGAFLSGGVDSSLVAAMMAKRTDGPIQAFTIGYDAEGAFMNELVHARKVAAQYGMQQHELILSSDDLLKDLDKVVWHMDEPCGDPAAFLTLALSRHARQRVTVCLSGVGGDELFVGYRRYLAILMQEKYRKIPAGLRDRLIRPLVERLPESRTGRLTDLARMARKFVGSVGDDVRGSWADMTSYLPQYDGAIFAGAMADVRRGAYEDRHFSHNWELSSRFEHPIDQVAYMDLKMYLADQLLPLQDKMSMAVSLEARVPMLDHRLVELAARVPADSKLHGRELKIVLKRLAEKYVPRECIYRRKQGFAAPVEAWLRGPLKELVHDNLSPDRVRDRGIFEPKFVQWALDTFYGGGVDLSMQIYQALVLELWLQKFVDQNHAAAA